MCWEEWFNWAKFEHMIGVINHTLFFHLRNLDSHDASENNWLLWFFDSKWNAKIFIIGFQKDPLAISNTN